MRTLPIALALALVLALAPACGGGTPRAGSSGERCRSQGVDDCPQGTICCAARSETGNTRMAGQCVPAPSCTEAP